MRIIAGIYKGRTLVWPKHPGVRPITAQLREALFAILGPLDDLSFLDAYAGSGSIGFEALSRGASHVTFVEMLPAAVKTIRQNVTGLEVASQILVSPTSIEKWLERSHEQFNVIVAGPPFPSLDSGVIDKLGERLMPQGLLILWHSSRIASPELKSLAFDSARTYGDSKLSFYKHN
jgi:16S rRNA (guanine966-N2)-methyltransferase